MVLGSKVQWLLEETLELISKIQMSALPYISCVTSPELSGLSVPSFLACKMDTIVPYVEGPPL